MPRVRALPSLSWLAGPLLLAGACSHDAPRNDPLDPQLTPPVTLQVALDDTAGVARLTWTRYSGEPEFEAYWVLRNRPREVVVDTLAEIAEVSQTEYVDTTSVPGVEYDYRVSSVNAGGLETPSTAVRTRPLSLPSSQIESLDLDSRTATARVTWTPYRGPRFRAYEIQRQSGELAWRGVAALEALGDTSYTDTGLVGNTEYSYRVAVVTERGKEAVSQERRGGFHSLVDTWPLDVSGDEYVRLYREGDRVTALLASRDAVRLHIYGKEGQILDQQALWHRGQDARRLIPQSVSTALTPDELRLVSMALQSPARQVAVMLYTLDGRPNDRERELFPDTLAVLISGAEARVSGGVGFTGHGSSIRARYRDLTVSAAEEMLYAEDLGQGLPEGWGSTAESSLGDGWLSLSQTSRAGTTRLALAYRLDESWQSFRVEADVIVDGGTAGIRLGTGVPTHYSTFDLLLSPKHQQVELWWSLSPPPDVGLSRRSASLTAPLPILPEMAYRLSLGSTGSAVRAGVTSPVLWHTVQSQGSGLSNVALVGSRAAFITGPQPYTLDQEGQGIPHPAELEAPVSDMRVWDVGGTSWLGFCLPQANQVIAVKAVVSMVTGQIEFPGLFSKPRTVGYGSGKAPGKYLFPISFDVGPDGRFYVLDAGNARIQVFDQDGACITQWGDQGSDAGEFDFTWSGEGEAFAGSLCVDDEGYIYVADVLNRRIQKFSPN